MSESLLAERPTEASVPHPGTGGDAAPRPDRQRPPFVSVIIPVFNDLDRLRLCLDALGRQTYPPDAYEVIVVDNGSRPDQDPAPLADAYGRNTRDRKAVIAREPQPGSYAARNKGVSVARGEVLAFTDSDCVPAADWLEKGVAELLRAPGCGLVGGAIELFCRDPARPTACELYDRFGVGLPQEDFVRNRGFAATANAFTFRAVVEKVGPFDASLKSGGDLEWGRRVGGAGYAIAYAGPARVSHPARSGLRETLRRAVRISGGRYDMQRRAGRPRVAFCWDLARGLVPPLPLFFRTWRDKRLAGPSQKMKFVAVLLCVKYARSLDLARLVFGGKSSRG